MMKPYPIGNGVRRYVPVVIHELYRQVLVFAKDLLDPHQEPLC